MSVGEHIQIEDGGYTRIHSMILEALASARLNGSEFRCVVFLLRKTYGWNKKEDRISLSQWEAGTKTKRGHVLNTLNGLIEKHIIYRVQEEGNQIPVYGFNKYLDEWIGIEVDHERGARFGKSEVLPKQVTVTKAGNTTVTKAGNGTVTRIGTHKRQLKTIKNNTTHQEIFNALARVCRLDMKLKAGHIGKTAKSLAGAGYTAADVDIFAAWWRANDFRGRKGEPPTLANVTEKILQAKLAAKPAQSAATPELAKVVMSDHIEYWRGDVLERTEPLEVES